MFSKNLAVFITVSLSFSAVCIYVLISFEQINDVFDFRLSGFASHSHCGRTAKAEIICKEDAAQRTAPVCLGCNRLLEFGAESLDHKWQPFNCNMRTYSLTDLRRAVEMLRSRTDRSHVGILLIGDSRMRQLQTGLHRFLLGQSNYKFTGFAEETPPSIFCDRPDANQYHWFNETLQSCEFNRTFHSPNLSLARWWIPLLDAGTTKHRLQRLLDRGNGSMPHVVVLSGGLWLIRDCWNRKIPFSDCMTQYRRNVTNLLPILGKVARHSVVLWTLEYPVIWEPAAAQMNRKLEMLNDLLRKDLATSPVKIWESYSQAYDMGGDTPDGCHFGWKGLTLLMQIFLNFLVDRVDTNDQHVCCSSQS
ncbi:hypothetical protein RvY_00197 [Ramazzottius varieornatus]|uniref:SGNH domain-containing protein n=1 Tax=Ramazzottius varieornatus TaxID=947166 RepID=A0A1D1ULU8_RAMVA|nr:hypothetical protein RvY_00197 [Ramazzottius varieornatus]